MAFSNRMSVEEMQALAGKLLWEHAQSEYVWEREYNKVLAELAALTGGEKVDETLSEKVARLRKEAEETRVPVNHPIPEGMPQPAASSSGSQPPEETHAGDS